MVDLNQVVSETAAMLRRLLPENVELIVDLSSDMFLMKADPVRVSQVLMNLAINGRDAMPDGGVLTISTSKRMDSDRCFVCLEVADTGEGMSSDTRAKMFEPFFTTKQGGRGTGLGLATVKEIVEQNKAQIFVESEIGVGTRFRIEFPACLPDSREIEAPERSVAALDEIVVNGRVLVCEDDVAVRTAVCDYLEAIGIQVARCGNASEALAEAAKAVPKILITDVIMPGQNGLQLAQTLQRQHNDLKVLLITGHTEHEILNDIESQKNFCLLQKPFTTMSLMRHFRELNASSSA
jgi:two-component system, cell cycle sensor histidine kinase and response regulator CckA